MSNVTCTSKISPFWQPTFIVWLIAGNKILKQTKIFFYNAAGQFEYINRSGSLNCRYRFQQTSCRGIPVTAFNLWVFSTHVIQSNIYLHEHASQIVLSFSSHDSCGYKRVKSAGALPCWPIEWRAQWSKTPSTEIKQYIEMCSTGI